ncbi:NAD(P)-binding protein [Annulohypoxylon truncatum]|uniref:NAD(P)-binding protein n=1 Tax=Annulohypoxylon truncatum TaxID=327061 RepID=UPI0020075651|nr:NAD(P)-binding protein [Annulohypoxylon truncatum]KAI1210706.1 NAD(P)-binding protein [Annulohypoxylon truncatum]
MSTIAITGASGKLGNATLTALLAHNLVSASSIVALTSSSSPSSATWTSLAAQNPALQIRHASFDDQASFEKALSGVDKLFLVSTPHVELDFEDESGREKPEGEGREKHHRVAIDAAVKVGVRHVYYSSLAFGWDARSQAPGSQSKAGVMRAHLRTEAYLARLAGEGKVKVTVIREGLYNESWPLYLFGYKDAHAVDDEVAAPVAGDGKVCWTAIKDLGIASALIIAADSGEYDGKTVYLSTRPAGAKSLAEVAEAVGKARGEEVKLRVVDGEEYETYHVEGRGGDRRSVRWWAGTYEAIQDGECEVDDPTLEGLLASVGVKSTGVEECIQEMVTKTSS